MTVIRDSKFLEIAQSNQWVKKALARIGTGAYAIETQELITELHELHEKRVFRSYKTKEVLGAAQAKLVRASIQEASFRSRAVAIKMECFKVSELLQTDLDATTRYLGTKYADLLAQEFRSVDDRKAAIKHVLEGLHQLARGLKTVMDSADMLIDDIDQSGFSLQRVLGAMQLSFSRERNL